MAESNGIIEITCQSLCQKRRVRGEGQVGSTAQVAKKTVGEDTMDVTGDPCIRQGRGQGHFKGSHSPRLQ